MSYDRPIRASGLTVGTLTVGQLQALVTRWGLLWESLTTRGCFAQFKSPPENLANVQKAWPRLKAILKNLLRRR